MFDEIIKGDVMHISKDELKKVRDARFIKWFKNYVVTRTDEIDPRILEISYGPGRMIRCYKGYFINGFKFHTLDYGQNLDIIELEYFGIGNRVVLFKCHWFDSEKCIKHKLTKFIIVVIHQGKEIDEIVNLLIEDEDDDMQKDEGEEDEMEGDENKDDDEEEDELEDDTSETLSDDSDNKEEHEFDYFEKTMVKGKHSKPRPRSTKASESMSLPMNAREFADLSIQQQMQQEFNDVPFETPSLLGASAEQVENETSIHDSRRSPSIDLGASVDNTFSRSRGKGPSVGLQTLVDPSNRLRITPIGERGHHYNHKDHRKSLQWSMVDMEESP
ncbi:Uncharacterized protein TCM_039579 [Theobroma cacao]|uniref:DUF4216 domain-containing protein n=1 Tax=Theobroma cacao TaxID=3641 RepID=A0A061GY90_THECC|nr:Uncharacterized protein TCM_039579 [Theobroma cacao]